MLEDAGVKDNANLIVEITDKPKAAPRNRTKKPPQEE